MRLTKGQQDYIKKCVSAIDPDAKVYLFGSRCDNRQKGGDIDLFILSRIMNYSGKINLKSRLFEQLDEQKIDIIITRDLTTPFIASIFPRAIEL